ncbi:unnamed protein product, partial [Penicillium nalgiovense]
MYASSLLSLLLKPLFGFLFFRHTSLLFRFPLAFFIIPALLFFFNLETFLFPYTCSLFFPSALLFCLSTSLLFCNLTLVCPLRLFPLCVLLTNSFILFPPALLFLCKTWHSRRRSGDLSASTKCNPLIPLARSPHVAILVN